MPDGADGQQTEEEVGAVLPMVKAEELPAINPPQTKTPISFNQQVNNVQQIPPSAWDGLTPAQRIELTRSILEQMDSMDKRHYDFAITHIESEARAFSLPVLTTGQTSTRLFANKSRTSLLPARTD